MGCFLFLAAFSIVKIMLDADGGRAADATPAFRSFQDGNLLDLHTAYMQSLKHRF